MKEPRVLPKDCLRIGKAGEHLVLYDLLLQGYESFLTSQGMGYDIVVDLEGNLIRLQVKATLGIMPSRWRHDHQKGRIYQFCTKYNGRNSKHCYENGDFDGWAFAMLDIKEVAYLTWKDGGEKSSVSIRDRRCEYSNSGRKTGIRYWQDLTWENFLNELSR